MSDFDDEEPTTQVVDVPMAELVRQPTKTRIRERRATAVRGSAHGRVVVGVR